MVVEICLVVMALVRQIMSLGRRYDDDNWTVLGIPRQHRCYRLIYGVIIAQTFASSVYSGLVSAVVLELFLSSFYSNLTSIISGLFTEFITDELFKKFIQRSLIRTHKALPTGRMPKLVYGRRDRILPYFNGIPGSVLRSYFCVSFTEGYDYFRIQAKFVFKTSLHTIAVQFVRNRSYTIQND